MDNNPGSAQNGQPSQGGQFGSPQPQPMPPQPVSGQGQQPIGPYDPSTIAIKPAWQVEVMQKMWQQQGDRAQVVATPYRPEGSGPQLQTPSWQQPYGADSQFQPQTPQFSMAAPQVGQPNPAQIPPTGMPPQQPLPPNMPSPPQDDSYTQRSGSKKWMLIIILLLVLIAAGGAALFMLLRGGQGNDPQKALMTALTQAFKTQTYNENMIVQENGRNTTYSRIADFRKLGEPHVYIDNILPPTTKSTVQVTIYGGDYYARKHFASEDIAKADDTAKAYIAKLQDKWIQVVDDGKATQDRAITDYINVGEVRAQRVVVPAAMVVGYFPQAQQQKLIDFAVQNAVYTTPHSPSAKERLDGQAVMKLTVAVNAAKATELNAEVGELIGGGNTPALEMAAAKMMPDQMEMWLRQSDSRLMKYSYKKDGITYTFSYDKIDQAQEVSRPRPEGAAPEGANASDADTKDAVTALSRALSEYTAQGNTLPAEAASFGEFVTQKVDTTASNRFSMQFKDGTPERGYIFYQTGKKCNAANNGLEAADPGSRFALLTKLSASLYCVDNTD